MSNQGTQGSTIALIALIIGIVGLVIGVTTQEIRQCFGLDQLQASLPKFCPAVQAKKEAQRKAEEERREAQRKAEEEKREAEQKAETRLAELCEMQWNYFDKYKKMYNSPEVEDIKSDENYNYKFMNFSNYYNLAVMAAEPRNSELKSFIAIALGSENKSQVYLCHICKSYSDNAHLSLSVVSETGKAVCPNNYDSSAKKERFFPAIVPGIP